MNGQDFIPALVAVVDAFEQLGIPYHIGGSVASIAYGQYRNTADVDLVADIQASQVVPLVRMLQDNFYADDEMIFDALRQRSSFNFIHNETGYKVDVFLVKAEPYDRAAFMRADLIPIDSSTDSPVFFVASPEDTVLNKLRWFRLGGETSERQWLDVQGVLKVQAEALDFAYMRKWAPEIGVADLLERAIAEADLFA
jgi:hypothetical protein